MATFKIITYVIGNRNLPGLFIKKVHDKQNIISINQMDDTIRIYRKIIKDLILVLEEFKDEE